METKNWEQISKDLQKYGIKRSTHRAEKPPLDGHSTMIKNEACGVEPWVLEQIETYKQEHYEPQILEFEKEYE